MDANERIFEAIGSLKAEVTGLRRDLQNSVEGAQEDIRRAEQSRTDMHERMNELVDTIGEMKVDISTVKSDLAATKSDVAESKEVTDKVKKWELMGMGALAVTGVASAAITALFYAYGTEALKFFRII